MGVSIALARRNESDMNTTTVAPQTPKAPPLQKETTVGNYFVSNYPPFSFWKPEQTGELFAALERNPLTPALSPKRGEGVPKGGRAVVPLGVYVHIPFCRKRCHFCYFKV